MSEVPQKIRIDKWLWAARFYKTRSLAATEIDKNRIRINQQDAKPSREVRVGDLIEIRRGTGLNQEDMTVTVIALSSIRGPAAVARTLYEETQESIKARETVRQKRKFMDEPANSIEKGRPTKRDRRKIADWQRWSAVHSDE